MRNLMCAILAIGAALPGLAQTPAAPLAPVSDLLKPPDPTLQAKAAEKAPDLVRGQTTLTQALMVKF